MGSSFVSEMRIALLLLFGFMWLNGTESVRLWTNFKGVKMEASLIRFKKDKIEIHRGDGRIFTLSPTMFSEEDQKYLTDARTRTDSGDEFWSKERATYRITKSKWIDEVVGSRTFNLFEFKGEKVDLNKDGKLDGYLVWKRGNRGSLRKSGFPMAWEVSTSGNLIIRTFDGNGVLYVGELQHDLENKSFKRVKGYGGINFLTPFES
jgi:hypothetical protein|tara:strand:- start:99 stop:716 length:618 start_codon:yes stop_codon:yes gene_type:complete